MHKNIGKKILKYWNEPGSSPGYHTPILNGSSSSSEKLGSTCPQVDNSPPNTRSKQDTTFPKHKVMHFCASSGVQRKQLTSTYLSNRADSSSLRQNIDLHPSIR